MTLPEFFGCSCVAFGPPLALFVFTVANDPVRIIILIAAAFFWLLSVLSSALVWYALVPLRDFLAISVTFSVLCQEFFRYVIYRILRRTEQGLQAVADDVRINENKHILAYVSGLGFGIISSLFALVNILADMSGPGTMGLKGDSEHFFVVSATQALFFVLLHTFWSVIFFNAFDTGNYVHIGYVVGSHLFVSLLTLISASGYFAACSFIVTSLSGALAFRVAGGSVSSLRRFVSCQ